MIDSPPATPAAQIAPDGTLLPSAGPTSSQPALRVPSPKEALSIILAVTKHPEHEARLERYQAVEEAYDRMPPDSDAALAAEGEGGATNVNWGGLEGAIDEAVEPFYNVATDAQTYIRCIGLGNNATRVDAMKVIAQEDKRMMDRWARYPDATTMMVHNMIAHGCGVFMFDQPGGWHFSSVHPANVVVPVDKTGNVIDSSKWPWFAVSTSFSITSLIEKLEQRKNAKVAGWNVSAIKAVIERFCEQGGMELSRQINLDGEASIRGLIPGGDLAFASANKMSIDGFVMFVREHDGSITHLEMVKDEAIPYIYEKRKAFGDFHEIIHLFIHRPGQGVFSRVRGFGARALPAFDAADRAFNQYIDSTTLASNLMLQGGEPDDIHRARLVRVGSTTFIPDGLQVVQQSFSNTGAGHGKLAEEIEARLSRKSKQFGGAVDLGGHEKTLGEARMVFQSQTSLGQSELARFIVQLSRFHLHRMKRVLGVLRDTDPGAKEAKEMLQRCVARGVTPEDIKGIDDIEAARIFGDGDPVNLFLSLMDVKGFEGLFSEQGRRNLAEDAIDARLRQRGAAKRYLGDAAIDDRDTVERNRAQGENADFESSGVRIDVTGVDDHIIHAGEHTTFAQEVLQRHQAGEIPRDIALSILGRVKTHNDDHLKGLARDPLAADGLKAQMQVWAEIVNQMRRMAQMLADEQAAAQQQAAEDAATPAVPMSEVQRANKAELDMQIAQEQHAQALRHKEEAHKLDMDLKRRTAGATGPEGAGD